MVTLIGFLFILANILLLVIVMPDLVGPVRLPMFPSQLVSLLPQDGIWKRQHGEIV